MDPSILLLNMNITFLVCGILLYIGHFCVRERCKKSIALLFALVLLSGCGTNETVDHDENGGSVVDRTEDCAGEICYFETGEEIIYEGNGKRFNLSFWFFPTEDVDNMTLFSIPLDKGHLLMRMGENGAGTLAGISLSDEDEKIVSGENNIVFDSWNQIRVLKDNDRYSIYLNGKHIGSGDLHHSAFDSQIKVLFGMTEACEDPIFNGRFANHALSDRKMNDDQIYENYLKYQPAFFISEIHLSDSKKIIGDLYIPENHYTDMALKVESSNQSVLTSYGWVRPQDEDTDVHLTFSASNAIASAEKDFHFTVLSEIPQADVLESIGYIVNEHQQLPLCTSSGIPISWSSDEVDIIDGVIYKKQKEPRVNAVLTADVADTVYRFEVTVLDEFSAYIMAYFGGPEGNETGRLLYSYDGFHWEKFGTQPTITSDLGSGRVRDPYLFRDKDGTFKILATQGYDYPEIYLWNSADLIDLSDHRTIRITGKYPGRYLSGERAWAPEAYYDADDGYYTIIFSDPGDENSPGTFFVTTKDFCEFTQPEIYFDRGFPVIDATLLPYKNRLLMFYKDEREGAKTIFYGIKDHISSAVLKYRESSFLSLTKYLEGPTAFKLNDEERYVLYADNYPNGRFLCFTFTDIGKDFRQLSETEYSFPTAVRHGSIIPVTAEELNKMLQAYK